jgi:hypothetical protein
MTQQENIEQALLIRDIVMILDTSYCNGWNAANTSISILKPLAKGESPNISGRGPC